MSKLKCRCGELAHVVIEGRAYCAKCASKTTKPKPPKVPKPKVKKPLVNKWTLGKIKNPEKVERPKEWSKPPTSNKYFKTLQQCTEPKKPWWKKLLDL